MVRPGGTSLFGQNGYEIENLDVLFLEDWGTLSDVEKKHQSREANQQQTRLMYGIAIGIWAHGTLKVCGHHGARIKLIIENKKTYKLTLERLFTSTS